MMVEGCLYWEPDWTTHLKRDELGAVRHHVEVRANALVLGEHLRFQVFADILSQVVNTLQVCNFTTLITSGLATPLSLQDLNLKTGTPSAEAAVAKGS